MNPRDPSRRDALKSGMVLLLAAGGVPLVRPPLRFEPGHAPADSLAAVEARLGGRVGVSALDTGSGRRLEHRAGERFAMCSTFKWLLATQVLSRVDAGAEQLDREVRYGETDLLDYAPITRQHVSAGHMSVSALCAAAIEYSDNTAANLLLATVGGPAGLTQFLRSIGDAITRLDRTEPGLNSALTGDPRDTTTPAAMVHDLERVLLGSTVLAESSRTQLRDWMLASTTGKALLRAGLPAAWRVGDKTGSGGNGATNDVAIILPPGRPPILVAAYLMGSKATAGDRAGALAEVGTIVAETFG